MLVCCPPGGEDIGRTADTVAERGFPVAFDDDFPGYRRFYTADGNGNRVEILSVT